MERGSGGDDGGSVVEGSGGDVEVEEVVVTRGIGVSDSCAIQGDIRGGGEGMEWERRYRGGDGRNEVRGGGGREGCVWGVAEAVSCWGSFIRGGMTPLLSSAKPAVNLSASPRRLADK